MNGEEIKHTREELEEKLSDKERVFCHEYIKDWNKSRAARVAGYSEDSAKDIGYQISTKLYIKQYIEFIKDDIAKEAGISKLSLINELKLLAFSNLPAIILKYEKEGLEGLTEEEQKVISEYDNTKKELGEGGTLLETKTKLKTHDKRGAIQDILKAMGWNEPDRIKADISVSPFLDLMQQTTADDNE